MFSARFSRTLQRYLDGLDRLPPRPLLVTFDDGYRNNLTYAVPELEEQGIPAIFHVATGYIGATGYFGPTRSRMRVLQWTQPCLPLPGNQPSVEVPEELSAEQS